MLTSCHRKERLVSKAYHLNFFQSAFPDLLSFHFNLNLHLTSSRALGNTSSALKSLSPSRFSIIVSKVFSTFLLTLLHPVSEKILVPSGRKDIWSTTCSAKGNQSSQERLTSDAISFISCKAHSLTCPRSIGRKGTK